MEPGQLVWFITGTSSGFGEELVKIALSRGDRVIATVRKLKDAPEVPEADRERLHVVTLDVTDPPEALKKTADAAAAVWGQIDVLVNNAGYGVTSILEEASMETWSKAYQTNMFGIINVTHAVLPHMRARRSGTIVMLGSRAAWQASAPFIGYYASSKAAIHALGETYATELKPLGIRVCIVSPGGFRTKTLEHMYLEVDNPVADYDPMRPFSKVILDSIKNAQGDPHKAMNLLVDAVRGEGKAKGKQLPLYLLMGGVTFDKVREYCKKMQDSMEEWEGVAKDLDFDQVPAPETKAQ